MILSLVAFLGFTGLTSGIPSDTTVATIDSTTYTVTKAVPFEMTHDSRLESEVQMCGDDLHYFDLQQHQWKKLQIDLPRSRRKWPREQYCIYKDSSLLISTYNYNNKEKLIRIQGTKISREGVDSVCGFKMPSRGYGLINQASLLCTSTGFTDGKDINILTPPKRDQELFKEELTGRYSAIDLGHYNEYPIVKWRQGKCLYFLSNYGSKTEVCGRKIRYMEQVKTDFIDCEDVFKNGIAQRCKVVPNRRPVNLIGELFFNPKDSSKVYTNCFFFSRNSSSFFCPSANGLDTFPRTPDSAIKHSGIQADPPLLRRQSTDSIRIPIP